MKKDCVRLSISLVESFLHGMSVKNQTTYFSGNSYR